MGVQATTLPIDTAKVRLQLQKKAAAGDATAAKYKGLLDTITTITREEGLAALWKGIIPGLHRQCLFGGLRISLYDPVCLFISFLTTFYPFFGGSSSIYLL
jgi:solute carrier family 25 (mitochondrial uncoupling protein), member 8/9